MKADSSPTREEQENQELDLENQEENYQEEDPNSYIEEIKENSREYEEDENSEEENVKVNQEEQDYENSGEISQNSKKIISQNIKKKEKYHQGIERISEAENEGDDKYHSIFDRINNEAHTDDYQLNEENFEEIMRQNINSQNVNKLLNPTLYNPDPGLKFQPEINAKSKILAEVKKYKSQDMSAKSGKTPIEIDLYQDALKRKEKQQKLEYNNMMGIHLNASKTKISNNSHRIAINKVEKLIESSVSKFEKEKKKLSFIEVGEILTELKLFREIFPTEEKDTENKNKKIQTYKDIKSELSGVKDREKRKKAEVDFYEQLWLGLNSDNKEFIKSDIFSEFLKILFSPVASSVKEITSVLQQFLKAAYFLNLNQEEDKNYVSPITEKNLSEEDIWPLEKLVHEFLSLKENILAYQNINNPSKKLLEDMEQYKKQKLSFQPNAGQKKFISRSNFFEERIPVLMNLEKQRLQEIEEAKKEKEQNLLKECTFKPKINKPLVFSNEDENNLSGNNSQPVHEKLYSKYKESQNQKVKQAEEIKKLNENKELNECTFKPDLVSQKTYEKSINSEEKPKGFTQTVERMRKGIIENLKKKYMMKNIPKGENYEKVKKANIKPFNITDLKRKEEANQKSKSKIEDDGDNYFQMQITITTGKERTLRIHRNDDPYQIATELAKIYSMKDEVRDRLAQTILQFMSTYLRRRDRRRSTRRLTLRMSVTGSAIQHSVIETNTFNFDKI